MPPVSAEWQNFGIAGLLIFAILTIAKLWISSAERVQMERTKVEDKKADAMASALTSLSGKIDTHHTADILSHNALDRGISELKGHVLEAINWQERTPVESPIPTPRGIYGVRPKSGGG